MPQSRGRRRVRRRSEPADADRRSTRYLTPTSEKFKDAVTKVAPLAIDEKTGEPTRQTVCRRPALESRDGGREGAGRGPQAHAAAAAGRRGQGPRAAAGGLAEGPAAAVGAAAGQLPAQGKGRIAEPADGRGEGRPEAAAEGPGELDHRPPGPGLVRDRRGEAAAARTSARPTTRSTSSTATGRASRRPSGRCSRWRRKLAASPVVLTDDDVAEAVKLAGPRDVVQLISYVDHPGVVRPHHRGRRAADWNVSRPTRDASGEA